MLFRSFCPEGSLTYNSQCSFVFEYQGEQGKVPVYMGDRWSYPRQASAATLVLLPLEIAGRTMRISQYRPVWSPDTLETYGMEAENSARFCSNVKGESIRIDFEGTQIALFGSADSHGGYGDLEIADEKGRCVHKTSLDFYSGVLDEGLRYLSPVLTAGKYRVKLTVSGANSVCVTKNGTRYGSDDCYVYISGWSSVG